MTEVEALPANSPNLDQPVRDLRSGPAHPNAAAHRHSRHPEAPEIPPALVPPQVGGLRLRADSSLPSELDRTWVNGWLHRSYQAYWSTLATT